MVLTSAASARDAQNSILTLCAEHFHAGMSLITDLDLHLRNEARMSDFQTEMNRTVQGFVAQITELARRAAITTLESAFGERAARGASSGGGGGGGTAAAALLDGAARVGRPRGGRGAKRTAADLEALSEQVATFIKGNPGLRIEQINKELGTTTKDLALPIRKLIADGAITAEGQKRSTTYFAGGKKAKAPRKKKK
ncbi:MAG TPA: hypothetical protein VH165_19010 [Kofleriaceae bacterium]|nr:hypothetical protein [Kofleriaceae bacterium]